ncbi:MAG: ATP-binding protein [Cyanobacteria bacterium P01_A01_bin.123]
MGYLDPIVLDTLGHYRRQAASLLIYQAVLDTPPSQAFLHLLGVLEAGESEVILRAYGRWFKTLANAQQTWQSHLIQQILRAENGFTHQIQQSSLEALPPALVNAVRHDLQALQQLYLCQGNQLSIWVRQAAQMPETPVVWDADTIQAPVAFPSLPDWSTGLAELADYYQQKGIGLFADYRVLRWQQGKLVGIAHPDESRLDQLVGYALPKQTLIQNTEFLLSGFTALHVLLYGSRGSGKSSLVKALANHYGDRGLRLIEVTKADLYHLPHIVEQLRSVPQKFIIFVDDLSFEEDDEAFKALKVVLEGSVTARPQNVVVYATSNRRHLIREFFGDRPRPSDADEIHNWDTVQEKLSFSDRFGLTLTFEPADQSTYLEIVRHLAAQAQLNISPEDLEYRSLQWATRRNGRSGRTARQFIDYLTAELATMNNSTR